MTYMSVRIDLLKALPVFDIQAQQKGFKTSYHFDDVRVLCLFFFSLPVRFDEVGVQLHCLDLFSQIIQSGDAKRKLTMSGEQINYASQAAMTSGPFIDVDVIIDVSVRVEDGGDKVHQKRNLLPRSDSFSRTAQMLQLLDDGPLVTDLATPRCHELGEFLIQNLFSDELLLVDYFLSGNFKRFDLASLGHSLLESFRLALKLSLVLLVLVNGLLQPLRATLQLDSTLLF